MANPNAGGAGTLYYTLDGSDPRLLGGGRCGGALVYSGRHSRHPDSHHSSPHFKRRHLWSGLEDATFTLDSSALRVTEVMYNPPLPPAGSPYIADDFEYLEIYNSGGTAIDMSGMKFDQRRGHYVCFGAPRWRRGHAG